MWNTNQSGNDANGRYFAEGMFVSTPIYGKTIYKVQNKQNTSEALTKYDFSTDLIDGDHIIINNSRLTVKSVEYDQRGFGKIVCKEPYHGPPTVKGTEYDVGLFNNYVIDPAERSSSKQIETHVMDNFRSGDIELWDITCLSEALIAHTRQLVVDSDVVKLVEKIRHNRNSYVCHKSEIALGVDDFTNCAKPIEQLINYCITQGIIHPGHSVLQEHTSIMVGEHDLTFTPETFRQRIKKLNPEDQIEFLREDLGPVDNESHLQERIGSFLEGTRCSYVDKFLRWVDTPAPKSRCKLFCISGSHGTGKSVLLSHFYDLMTQQLNALPHVKSIHFYQYNAHDSMNEALRTLAYGIASDDSADRSKRYREDLLIGGAKLKEDKISLTSAEREPRELVTCLFTDRLGNGYHTQTPILLFIDAIDECCIRDRGEQINQLRSNIEGLLGSIRSNVWIVVSNVEPLSHSLDCLVDDWCIHLDSSSASSEIGSESFGDIQKFAEDVICKQSNNIINNTGNTIY